MVSAGALALPVVIGLAPVEPALGLLAGFVVYSRARLKALPLTRRRASANSRSKSADRLACVEPLAIPPPGSPMIQAGLSSEQPQRQLGIRRRARRSWNSDRVAAMPCHSETSKDEVTDVGSNFDGAPEPEVRLATDALERGQAVSYQSHPA